MTTDTTTGTGRVAPTAEETPARPGPPGPPQAARLGPLLQRYALVLILGLLLLLCLAAIPEFRSWRLVSTMVNGQSIILLLALVATIVLRTGDFDLSISQTMVSGAAVVAVMTAAGAPPLLAAGVALLLGLAVGVVNALLVVVVGVDSFVVTLGSFTALSGFAYLITGSGIVAGVPDVFINTSRSTIAGLPLITWYAWLLAGVLWYVYQRTPLGRYTLFIGGNRDAARLAGLRVREIRFGAYLLSGLLAAAVGIVFAGYFGAVDPSAGSQYMLQPFAAVFLGATAIAVGRFNALGTVVALYLLTVGITGLQLLGAQTWVTNVFYGLALMVAVSAAKLAGRRRAVRS